MPGMNVMSVTMHGYDLQERSCCIVCKYHNLILVVNYEAS